MTNPSWCKASCDVLKHLNNERPSVGILSLARLLSQRRQECNTICCRLEYGECDLCLDKKDETLSNKKVAPSPLQDLKRGTGATMQTSNETKENNCNDWRWTRCSEVQGISIPAVANSVDQTISNAVSAVNLFRPEVTTLYITIIYVKQTCCVWTEVWTLGFKMFHKILAFIIQHFIQSSSMFRDSPLP